MVEIAFDRALIEKYDVAGPRYTSYPTALQFDDSFGETQYRRIASASNATVADLSLYFHIPFCARLCYYCACNKVVTKQREISAPYIERLEREIATHASLYDRVRTVTQVHWGGGTPTFLTEAQMRRLMAATREHFDLADDARGEYGIELDPRELRSTTLEVLREIGFNRVSLGVQDFEPRVQRAVNRVQSIELTAHVIDEARRLAFRSVSIDLIYGLPFQTFETIARTLDVVVVLSPDRISIYNYAHLPERFPPQRRLSLPELPNAELKLDLLQLCIERLTGAGYRYIGMDHFAKPADELAMAQDAGRLYRNFQGYSTRSECDLIGFGLSGIGTVAGSFYQNERELPRYDAALDSGRLPIARGLEPDAEDRLRREVIMRLICAFELEYAPLEQRFDIEFAKYFAEELTVLRRMADDGLLEINARGIAVTANGRFLIRNVCMVFDRYTRGSRASSRFSKTI